MIAVSGWPSDVLGDPEELAVELEELERRLSRVEKALRELLRRCDFGEEIMAEAGWIGDVEG